MQSANNITNLNKYEDVVDKVTVIENNISTLQSYTVSKGKNFGVVPSVFNNLTTFLGCNVQLQPGQNSISGSIALGTGVVINNSNQLMVASTITSFNISGLTPSTGSGEGTVLEFIACLLCVHHVFVVCLLCVCCDFMVHLLDQNLQKSLIWKVQTSFILSHNLSLLIQMEPIKWLFAPCT